MQPQITDTCKYVLYCLLILLIYEIVTSLNLMLHPCDYDNLKRSVMQDKLCF